jgi:NADPH:quinone reductase
MLVLPAIQPNERTTMTPLKNLQIMSRMTVAATLELWLESSTLREPAPDEVVIRVEGAPVNPADLLQLVGPADLSTLVVSGTPQRPRLSARIPAERMSAIAGRLGQAQPVGNEGAGTIIRAGAEVSDMLGRVVAMRDGMYTELRLAKAADCMLLPLGTSSREGAAAAINPMTALGMVETMRREGHHALVHTAAASSVGQMLNRLCIADGIPLVNIVRSPNQVTLMETMGATHVLDSTQPEFLTALRKAVDQTDATLAFDALGGGRMAGDILVAMEAAQSRRATQWSRYGSRPLKQVYVYGVLDRSPKVIEGNIGTAWAMGGWLMSWFMESIGDVTARRLRDRVGAELTTLFASQFGAQMSLAEALQPHSILGFSRNVTGGKALLVPNSPIVE